MSNIESVLQENQVFEPSKDFVKRATVSGLSAYETLCAEAEADYEGFGPSWRRNICYGTSHSQKF